MTLGQRFLEELHEYVLIGDGATGTALFARGVIPERGVERMNLLDPQKVSQLHRDYISAGSRVIETNTFGANIPNLAKYGVESEEEVREIIHAGVKLAREAAGDGNGIYVAGSVGPLPMQDGEPLNITEQADLFKQQISALLEGNVDTLIFESFTSLNELICAVKTARIITDIPIIAQAAFGPEKHTADGVCAEDVASRCIEAGANVVGANCGYGVRSTVNSIKQMASCGAPLSAYLNAGFPERVEDRLIYVTSPEYIVQAALDLVEMGVRLIGGCCGTDPELIRMIAQRIPQRRSITQGTVTLKKSEPKLEDIDKILQPRAPEFPIIVELDPPRDLNIAPVIAAAKELEEAGASAISVSDNPFASVRMDNLAVAGELARQSSLPIILHMTGRDRNRIAVQSTIMGAHMLNIQSLLCVTGDPVRMCEEPNTSGVFDLTSVGLVHIVSDFNNGHRVSGDCRTSFSIGVALNPNVRNIKGQIDKLKRKIEAGAHYVLTQPIFEESRLDIMQQAIDEAGIEIPIYVGVMPLVSSRNAEFLHNEIPGILIPEEIRKKLASYESVPDQRAAGIEIASKFVEKLAGRSNGFYFICPRNKYGVVIPLISTARACAPAR